MLGWTMKDMNNQRKLLFASAFVGLTLFVLTVSGSSRVIKSQDKRIDVITTEDKFEIIKLSLKYALLDENFKEQKFLPISTNDIEPELLPKLSGLNPIPSKPTVLLSLEKIHQKADSEGSFTYLWFSPLKSVNHRVTLTVGNCSAVKDEDSCYGSYSRVEYHRADGTWVGDRKESGFLNLTALRH